ncbi:MAG: DNA polymerase III subunit chi [Serpentinimonas sp.]|jgi:DNA polymerase-3 subunit chi|nr:DNA polymerase III subunit chi [Serpentinimonas sp.]
MTDLAFHFNVPDKVNYLCRLLRKATAAGKRSLVVAPEALQHDLDTLLWTFSQEDFVAHASWTAPEWVRDRSAVVLLSESLGWGAGGLAPASLAMQFSVLINSTELPLEGFEHFERFIEVVGLDGADREAGRRRWKHYTQRGFTVTRHDAGAYA